MQRSHAEKYRDFQEALVAYLNRKPAQTKKWRTNKARGFEPVLAWRQHAEDPEPAKSNWTLVADNDNGDGSKASPEMSLEIIPSPQEMERAAASVETAPFRHARLGGGGDEESVITGGNVEYGRYVDKDGKPHRVTVRIGKLRFSDGTHTEKVHSYGPDGKLIQRDAVVPVGAMLGTRERLKRMKGPSPASVGSNTYFAKMLGVDLPKHIPGKRNKRPSRPTPEWSTVEKRQAFLRDLGVDGSVPYDVARLNAGLPPLEKDTKAVLPTGSLAELFLGMRKTKTGQGGAIAWEDLYTSQRNAEAWRRIHAEMSATDRTVLDATKTARGLECIGSALGHSGEYARKVGRKALTAANDNLDAAIKKYVAQGSEFRKGRPY